MNRRELFKGLMGGIATGMVASGGAVSAASVGRPTNVRVVKIDEFVRPEELPTIEEVTGLVHDLTGGESLAKYLEHLRDG
jgi:hypothetical protein